MQSPYGNYVVQHSLQEWGVEMCGARFRLFWACGHVFRRKKGCEHVLQNLEATTLILRDIRRFV